MLDEFCYLYFQYPMNVMLGGGGGEEAAISGFRCTGYTGRHCVHMYVRHGLNEAGNGALRSGRYDWHVISEIPNTLVHEQLFVHF